jgi:hypothetical protein
VRGCRYSVAEAAEYVSLSGRQVQAVLDYYADFTALTGTGLGRRTRPATSGVLSADVPEIELHGVVRREFQDVGFAHADYVDEELEEPSV